MGKVQTVVSKGLHTKCVHLLHRRLGHVSFDAIKKTLALLNKEQVDGCKTFLDCDICKRCKSKAHLVAQKSQRVTDRPLGLIHSDVVGPFPSSHSKMKYLLLLADNASKFMSVFPLSHKSEVCETKHLWAKSGKAIWRTN